MDAKHKLYDLERMLLEDPLLVEGLIYCFTHVEQLKVEEDLEMELLDRRGMGEALLGVFKLNTRELDLLEMVSYKEVHGTVSESQLMREDSLFIAILQSHIRMVGTRWIYKKIAAPIRRIISNLSVVSYEINPRKITEFESVELNLRHLKEAVLSILTPILRAPEDIPTEVVYMCKMLFALTNKKFPGKGYRALASYLFLRFICPAIGAPESIGVIKVGHLKPIERRSLVLVAKIIQGIANEMPEQNEDYMQRLKEFIEENIESLRKFFDQVLVANVDNIFTQPSKRSYSLNHLLDDKRARKAVVKAQFLQTLMTFVEAHYKVMDSKLFESIKERMPEFDITRKRCELLLNDVLDESRGKSKKDLAHQAEELRKILLTLRQQADQRLLWNATYKTLVEYGACLPACVFFNLPDEGTGNGQKGRKRSKSAKRKSTRIASEAEKIEDKVDKDDEKKEEKKDEKKDEKKEKKEEKRSSRRESKKEKEEMEEMDEETTEVEEDTAEDSVSKKKGKKKNKRKSRSARKNKKSEESEKDLQSPQRISALAQLLTQAESMPLLPSLRRKPRSRGSFRGVLSRKKAPAPQRRAVMGGGVQLSSSQLLDGDVPRPVEFYGGSDEE